MIPLCILSVLIYGSAFKLFLYFSGRDFRRVTDADCRLWVKSPDRGRGEVGEIIRYVQTGAKSPGEIRSRYAEVKSAELPFIDRNISFIGILVTAAPLLGLLGTVMGMLLTFQSIGTGSDEVAGMMAQGISAALFPPEVGLCVALPGLVMVQLLRRKREEYFVFLAGLETRSVQQFRKPEPPQPLSGSLSDPVTESEPDLSGLEFSPAAG